MRPTTLISLIALIVTPLALAHSSSTYGDMYRRALMGDAVPVNRRDLAIQLLEILERRDPKGPSLKLIVPTVRVEQTEQPKAVLRAKQVAEYNKALNDPLVRSPPYADDTMCFSLD